MTLLLPNPRGRWPLAGGEGLGLRVPDVPRAARRPPRRSAELGQRRRARPMRGGWRTCRRRSALAADLVIDAGELPGTPSTVIDLRQFEAAGEWERRAGGRGEPRRRRAGGGGDGVESPPVRRLPLLVLAALLVPAPAQAARLPGPLVALAAGPGSAYAVTSTGSRTTPFRLVRSGGRSATALGTFGSRGAEFADVAAGPDGPVTVFGAADVRRLLLRVDGRLALGEGTGPPLLGLDARGALRCLPRRRRRRGDRPRPRPARRAHPDRPGAAAHAARPRRRAGRARPRPVGQSLRAAGPRRRRARRAGDLDRAACTRSPRRSRATTRTSTSRTARSISSRSPARPRAPTARWSRRRLRVAGELNGAPAIARFGLRTLVATSQRVRGVRSIYLTTAGPAGTFTDRLSRPRGSDLAPLAASGPDGRVYVGWTRRTRGSARRTGRLLRVL